MGYFWIIAIVWTLAEFKQSYFIPGRILKQQSSNKTPQKPVRETLSNQSSSGSNGHKRVTNSTSNGSSKGSSITKITNDTSQDTINNAAKPTNAKNGQLLNKTFESNRDGAKSSTSLNFSDLESTRIDFEETGTIVAHPILESDNNSDIIIDEKKIVPESSKFKIVFISSESKSGSELNSSMEYSEHVSPDNNDDTLNNVKGDFIDEVTMHYDDNNDYYWNDFSFSNSGNFYQ